MNILFPNETTKAIVLYCHSRIRNLFFEVKSDFLFLIRVTVYVCFVTFCTVIVIKKWL